jgi:Zn-dependent peptidase ImmA (M78 family)/DNA-binding XRE family transcriptional regulator
MLGERMRQARKARGWSLEMLAGQMGGLVSRQALFKYEKGQATPGSTVLLALASALGVSLEFFFRGASEQVRFGPLMCRKRAKVGARRLGAICAQARDQVERRLELESLFPPERFTGFRKPSRQRVEKLEDVEAVARQTRSALKIGMDPIENLTELLEDAGVKVIAWSGAEDGFDGFACWANERIPVVVIKAGRSGDRQRSNLAHELGHLVMDVGPAVDPEKAARRFAGAFLVPDDAVRRELSPRRHRLALAELQALKQKYGMSMQQWVYRARDLGILSAHAAAWWFQWFRRQTCYPLEPGAQLPEERSTRLGRLALQAVAEDLVSPARAGELAGVPVDELRQGAE